MKIATICLAFAFASVSADAVAQGAGDAMDKLRACSLLAQADRLDCLEKLSRDITPPSPARPAGSPAPEVAPAADNWIVSETTSPLDYTPVAIATALSSGGLDGAMQLSIQCRGGRTDLLLGGPALTGRGEDSVVSYVVNDGQPVAVAAGTSASGPGSPSGAMSCGCWRRCPIGARSLFASLPGRVLHWTGGTIWPA